MSHEIDETNGVASFAAREDAWHRLGTTVGRAMNAKEALDLAHLSGWNVRKQPLYTTSVDLTDDGVTETRLELPDRFATVRTNPVTGSTDYLGVVGNQYTPIQNEEHTDLLDALVDESGAHFETAGALRGGREVFVTMAFQDHLNIGGVDPVGLNIAALNSHDGSSAFRFIVTPVRIVCANTQAAALKGATAKFSARHTKNVRATIQQAREVLGLTFKYAEDFQEEAERMIQETMTNKQFEDMVADLWPEAAQKESRRFQERMSDLVGLFRHSSTNTEIRGTRWAGYQAVTEWVDHYAPVKGGAEGRANRVIGTGGVANHARVLKNRAFDLARVPA